MKSNCITLVMGLAIGIAGNAQEPVKPAPVVTNPPPTAVVVAPPAAPIVTTAPVPVAQPPPVTASSPPGVVADAPAAPPQGTVAPPPAAVEARPAVGASGATNPVAPVAAPVTAAPGTNAIAVSPEAAIGTNRAVVVRTPGTNAPIAIKTPEGLRMNFRSAPLDQILNFLSEAAGFVVTLETEVRGRFDVWSSKALTKEEAVDLLNVALSRNGYAAIATGNRLSIMSKDEAKRRNIPVKTGNKPEDIPANEQIVTQIIPLRSISAAQLLKDLQPILPPMAVITANEGGNAIVMTDTQSSIKRMVEIISALDTSVAGTTSIKVFPLTYADSKALATIIKELFAPDSGGRSGGSQQGMFGRMGQMASRFGGMPGMPGMQGGDSRGGGRTTATVVATADERSNAVIVNAPEHIMPVIEELIKTVDTSVEDETIQKVFPLSYADPVEMSELLTELFPDETQSSTTSRNSPFGSRFGAMGGSRTGSSGATGERAKKIGKVIAVPDQRTSSVIVSASKTMMPQIGDMIQQLDANPAKKQKVFVYTLENADVDQVETVLNELFQSQNSRSRSSSSRNNTQNALQNRATQNQRNTGSSSSSTFGNRSSRGN